MEKGSEYIMTTLREHLNQGTLVGPILEFYLKNKNKVPLCCFENKKVRGQWLIKCHWLKKYMTFEEFERKCKQCQQEMEEILERGGN